MHEKIKLAIISRDHEIYQQLFRNSGLDNVKLIQSSEEPNEDVLQHAEIILSEPDIAASFIHQCKSLKWLQSIWAGNNKLQFCSTKNYLLTGVKGVFYAQMKEYIFAFILSYYRELNMLKELQLKRTWQPTRGKSVEGLTLGILGFGDIGKQLVQPAIAFGMNIIGLNTNGGTIDSIACFSSSERLQFAGQCDIVVNLLPETRATCGFCDKDFFNNMRKEGLFINVGRGSVIDSPSTLIDALDKNNIGAAVLDVFENEPLPKEHPFYHHSAITITNHSAAISDPNAVFDLFERNYNRYINGEPLMFTHDFDKGY